MVFLETFVISKKNDPTSKEMHESRLDSYKCSALSTAIETMDHGRILRQSRPIITNLDKLFQIRDKRGFAVIKLQKIVLRVRRDQIRSS